MLSYHLLDHSIYCLPRVPNILDWTLPVEILVSFPFCAVGNRELWELAQTWAPQILGPPVLTRHVASILGFGQEIRPRGGDALSEEGTGCQTEAFLQAERLEDTSFCPLVSAGLFEART
jgi:hypothetical protein